MGLPSRILHCLNYPSNASFIVFLGNGFAGCTRSAIRLLLISAWGSIGFALGDHVRQLLGYPERGLAFWVCGIAGVVTIFLLLWLVTLGRLLLFFPFPPCRQGKCHSINEYEFGIPTIYGRMKWGVYFYRCHCGDGYVRVGKRFMEVSPDGTRRPYKKLTGFRTWSDDPATPESVSWMSWYMWWNDYWRKWG